MLLIKQPFNNNWKTGHVCVELDEWEAMCEGLITQILVIRDKDTTKLYGFESWMVDAAKPKDTYMLVPVTKGSPLYRRWCTT